MTSRRSTAATRAHRDFTPRPHRPPARPAPAHGGDAVAGGRSHGNEDRHALPRRRRPRRSGTADAEGRAHPRRGAGRRLSPPRARTRRPSTSPRPSSPTTCRTRRRHPDAVERGPAQAAYDTGAAAIVAHLEPAATSPCCARAIRCSTAAHVSLRPPRRALTPDRGPRRHLAHRRRRRHRPPARRPQRDAEGPARAARRRPPARRAADGGVRPSSRSAATSARSATFSAAGPARQAPWSSSMPPRGERITRSPSRGRRAALFLDHPLLCGQRTMVKPGHRRARRHQRCRWPESCKAGLDGEIHAPTALQAASH